MKHSYLEEEKFLEHKSKRKWKPYNTMTYEEKKNLAEKEAMKDHFKSVVKNDPKMLRSLDYSKKNLHKVKKPSTPHNTTQYLTANFSMGRNEKPVIISDFSPVLDELMNEEDFFGAEDFCIPGGSMKAKIIEMEREKAEQSKDDHTILNYLNTPEEAQIDYFSSGCKDLNEDTNIHTATNLTTENVKIFSNAVEPEDLRKYREIIEKQQQIISMLTRKLKRKASDVDMD